MSRGRGGGRGGRGGMTRSFNREQLTALGVGSNELLPGHVTQPPPLFPLRERHPVPLTSTLEIDYLLILRQDFIDHMQLSSAYVKLPETTINKPEQEIERLVAQLPSTKEKYDWALFPAELRPKLLGKRVKKDVLVKKEVNIQERLSELEKLEESMGSVPKIKDEPEDETIEEEEEALEQVEEDEEMDEGTDYANNYFDNGEGYEDEDDNLDDGPIY